MENYAINKIVSPILSRIKSMVMRATVTRVYDSDATQRAQISVLNGDALDKVERLSEYGFTSVPVSGAGAIALFLAGKRESAVIIATGDENCRVKDLSAGEVCVYDAAGSKILLKSDGSIVITPGGGTLVVNGSISAAGDVTADGISLKSHVHSGVSAGSGRTGAPVS